MPSRFDSDEPLPGGEIDVEKPYDIYVQSRPDALVVYRRAFFRGVRGLQRRGKYDFYADYTEIMQSNGQSVFVRRVDVVKFCEPEAQLLDERVEPPK